MEIQAAVPVLKSIQAAQTLKRKIPKLKKLRLLATVVKDVVRKIQKIQKTDLTTIIEITKIVEIVKITKIDLRIRKIIIKITIVTEITKIGTTKDQVPVQVIITTAAVVAVTSSLQIATPPGQGCRPSVRRTLAGPRLPQRLNVGKSRALTTSHRTPSPACRPPRADPRMPTTACRPPHADHRMPSTACQPPHAHHEHTCVCQIVCVRRYVWCNHNCSTRRARITWCGVCNRSEGRTPITRHCLAPQCVCVESYLLFKESIRNPGKLWSSNNPYCNFHRHLGRYILVSQPRT